jgi:hypothetical protein
MKEDVVPGSLCKLLAWLLAVSLVQRVFLCDETVGKGDGMGRFGFH